VEALAISRRIYEQLQRISTNPPPKVRTWSGETWGPVDAAATLVLQHPGSLRALLVPPRDLPAGEAYLFDDVDVEGDMTAMLEFAAGLEEAGRSRLQLLQVLSLARRLPAGARRAQAQRPRFGGRLHSRHRDRQAVRYHYDTGNEFFSTFLDPAMVYSSAYFLDPAETLESAQRRKLDLICRKLELQPGQRFLDVGCGWGALAIHAARQYGVEATGITLSAEQAEYARRWAKELKIESQVTILEADYREVEGRFDNIASVGMFEHVGKDQLHEYFSRLRMMLNRGGQLLNHGIVTRDRSRRRRRPSFISTYVFPDSDLQPLEVTVNAAERSGFELRDAESLRSSYALTLRHWVANLESNAEEAMAAAGERIYRLWRLYMAGSAIAFERSAISIYQMLFSDPWRPWTYGRRRLLAADDQ
jgi:cyclopropane-fatty-acyl-phospholipid synthase